MREAWKQLRLAPFRAVTYGPDIDLARVVCPPYDVISAEALQGFEAADPHNIVHLTLPRPGPCAEPGPPGDGDDRVRYGQAARELRRWLAAGVLRRELDPALYVYEHLTASGTAIGLVGCVGLNGPVLPHENTFPGPVADRAALMRTMRAQLEPILLTYDGDGEASDIVDAVTTTRPDREIEVDGERHRVWRLDDRTALRRIGADLAGRSALIADGHHRFAAYRAVHAEGPAGDVTGYGLAMLVDAVRHPLELRAVHRSVSDLPFEEAVCRAAQGFDVVPLDAGQGTAVLADEGPGAFVIGDDQHLALLHALRPRVLDDAMPSERPEGWRRLDAAVLTDVLLAHLWSVSDTDGRVRYHHAAADALHSATRTGGTAVIVRAPAVSEVLALAARGVRMPQKSTSFGPKPWTGLLMRADTISPPAPSPLPGAHE